VRVHSEKEIAEATHSSIIRGAKRYLPWFRDFVSPAGVPIIERAEVVTGEPRREMARGGRILKPSVVVGALDLFGHADVHGGEKGVVIARFFERFQASTHFRLKDVEADSFSTLAGIRGVSIELG
jgi:hypothetical protein